MPKKKKKMPKRKPVVHPYAPKTSKQNPIPRKKPI